MNEAIDAWRAFCTDLASMGEQIIEEGYPTGDLATAEGCATSRA